MEPTSPSTPDTKAIVKTEVNGNHCHEPSSSLSPPVVPSQPSTLPPKMVIAIDHSYAKNWEDLAFSPWNSREDTPTLPSPPDAIKLEKDDENNDLKKPLADPFSSTNNGTGDASNGTKEEPLCKEDADAKPTYLKSIVADELKDVVANGLSNGKRDRTPSDLEALPEAKSRKPKSQKKTSSSVSPKALLTRQEIQGIRRLLEILDKDPPQDVPELIGTRACSLLVAGWELLKEVEIELRRDKHKSSRGVTGVPLLSRFTTTASTS